MWCCRPPPAFPGPAVPPAEMQLVLPGLHSCWTGRAGSRWLVGPVRQEKDRMGSGLLGYGLGESPRSLVLSV